MEHAQSDTCPTQPIAGCTMRHSAPSCGRGVAGPRVEAAMRRNGTPSQTRARAKPRRTARAADVIRIGVREDERVERAHAECAQRRRDDALAEIERRDRRSDPAAARIGRPPASTSSARPSGSTRASRLPGRRRGTPHADARRAGRRVRRSTRDGVRSGAITTADEGRSRGCRTAATRSRSKATASAA